MKQPTHEDIRTTVRESYGRIAAHDDASRSARDESAGDQGADDSSCCSPSCCGSSSATDMARSIGYSAEELAAVPDGANLGLGCGNPQAIASLKSGETVLDLGSGAGFDCFLAARAVGPEGRVIGVDMTPEMIGKARRNAQETGVSNVEFRLGEIEALPAADGTVDVLISNCVINLSPEKDRVFREAFRVLKPGGRVAVADIVATAELPPEIRADLALHSGCIAGASEIGRLEELLTAAGFRDVRITPRELGRDIIREWAPGGKLEDYVLSASIEAVKPGA